MIQDADRLHSKGPALRVRSVRDLGALVRDRRRQRGWDQQELANRVGVSRLWISEMENGKPSVQLELVLRTLAALDVSLDVDGPSAGSGRSRSADLIRKILDDR